MYYYFIVISWHVCDHFLMIYRIKNKINKNKEIKEDVSMDVEMAFMCQMPTSKITIRLCKMQKQS